MRYLLPLLLCGCSTLQVPDYDEGPNPHEQVYKLVSNTGGTCTAFPFRCQQIGDQWFVDFLTCAHCTTWCGGYVTHHDTGDLGEVMDWQFYGTEDVAIFTVVVDEPVPVRKLLFTDPTFGQDLLYAGYYHGIDLWTRRGQASLPGLFGGHIVPGCSGGPVATMDGSVIGVISCILTQDTNCAYYVPLSRLKDWDLLSPN